MCKIVSGINIVDTWTLKSMYDNNCIALKDDDDNIYKMNIKELNAILSHLEFTVEKKRVHEYLIIRDIDDIEIHYHGD